MEDNFYSFRKTIVETSSTLTSKGIWSITMKITQKRKKNLDDLWEEKNAEITSFNEDIDKAIAECGITISTLLNSLAGDMFNEDPKKPIEVQ